MQQELIEMLEKMVKYFDELPSDSYYADETCSILTEAEKLVEKAKNNAPAQEQCNACLGTGRMVRDPDIGTDQECFVCDGSGYEPEQEVGLTDELEQLGHIANGIRICGVHDKRFVAQRIDDIIAALRAKGGK